MHFTQLSWIHASSGTSHPVTYQAKNGLTLSSLCSSSQVTVQALMDINSGGTSHPRGEDSGGGGCGGFRLGSGGQGSGGAQRKQ